MSTRNGRDHGPSPGLVHTLLSRNAATVHLAVTQSAAGMLGADAVGAVGSNPLVVSPASPQPILIVAIHTRTPKIAKLLPTRPDRSRNIRTNASFWKYHNEHSPSNTYCPAYQQRTAATDQRTLPARPAAGSGRCRARRPRQSGRRLRGPGATSPSATTRTTRPRIATTTPNSRTVHSPKDSSIGNGNQKRGIVPEGRPSTLPASPSPQEALPSAPT